MVRLLAGQEVQEATEELQRAELYYSIRKLSATTGLAYTTVFRYWHSYISRPDPEVLKKLARILEASDWQTLILDEE